MKKTELNRQPSRQGSSLVRLEQSFDLIGRHTVKVLRHGNSAGQKSGPARGPEPRRIRCHDLVNRVCMPCKNVPNVTWIFRHVPAPPTETAVLIDSVHPFVEEPPVEPSGWHPISRDAPPANQRTDANVKRDRCGSRSAKRSGNSPCPSPAQWQSSAPAEAAGRPFHPRAVGT